MHGQFQKFTMKVVILLRRKIYFDIPIDRQKQMARPRKQNSLINKNNLRA